MPGKKYADAAKKYDKTQLHEPAKAFELEKTAADHASSLAALLSWMATNNLSLLALDYSKSLPAESLGNWPVPLAIADAYVRLRDWQNLPRPARVVGVNVAGEATRVRVEAQLVRWRTTPEWLIAGEVAGGLPEPPALSGPGDHLTALATWYGVLHHDIRKILDEVGPQPPPVIAPSVGNPFHATG